MISLEFALLSRSAEKPFSRIKKSSKCLSFFSSLPHLCVLEQLRLMGFALRYLAINLFSDGLFIFWRRVVLIWEAFKLLVWVCSSFSKIVMTSLSVSVMKHVSKIQNLILFCTRNDTPAHEVLSPSLRKITYA